MNTTQAKTIMAGHVAFVMILTIAIALVGEYKQSQWKIEYLQTELKKNQDIAKKHQAMTAQMADLAFGEKGAKLSEVKALHVTVTSYNPTRKQGWGDGSKTADGNLAKPGVLAVSHDLQQKYGLKMGKKVVLKGYGTFVVGDLMHKRFTKRVDIISFIPNWSQKFGVQQTVIYFV